MKGFAESQVWLPFGLVLYCVTSGDSTSRALVRPRKTPREHTCKSLLHLEAYTLFKISSKRRSFFPTGLSSNSFEMSFVDTSDTHITDRDVSIELPSNPAVTNPHTSQVYGGFITQSDSTPYQSIPYAGWITAGCLGLLVVTVVLFYQFYNKKYTAQSYRRRQAFGLRDLEQQTNR